MISFTAKTSILASFIYFASAGLGYSCNFVIDQQYLQLSYPAAKSGAIYLRIANPCSDDDTLISANSDFASMAQLHQSVENSDGVVSMLTVQDGIPIPASQEIELIPGGYHIMIIGLELPEDKNEVELTLSFKKSGTVVINAPVRLKSE